MLTTTLRKLFCLSVAASIALTTPLSAIAATSFDYGVQLFHQQRFTDAINMFKRACMEDNTNADAAYYLALCYQRTGDNKNALYGFQHVIMSYPGTPACQLAAQGLDLLGQQSKQREQQQMIQAQQQRDAYYKELKRARAAQTAARAHPTKVTAAPTPSNDVKVPFQMGLDNHMYVNASINGHSQQMVFDTGADRCVFSKNQLRQLGVEPPSGPALTKSTGIGKDVDAWTMVLDIEVGGMRRSVPVVVQEELQTPPLLGETFYRGMKSDVDHAAGFIHFFKPGTGVVAAAVPTGTVDVPYRAVGTEMIVSVRVNDRPQDMIFDTGATSTAFTADDFKKLGLEVPSNGTPVRVTGVGGDVEGVQAVIASIEMGPIHKQNMPVLVLKSGLSLPLLGLSFIGDRRYTIDSERKVIRFWH